MDLNVPLNLITDDPAPKAGGHRYTVADQQKIYRSEIDRIWNAQVKALSDPREPQLTAEDEMRARGGQQRSRGMTAETPASLNYETPRTPYAESYGHGGETPMDMDDAGSLTRPGHGRSKQKAVRIWRKVISRLIIEIVRALTRLVQTNGKWSKEVIKDHRVAAHYIAARTNIEIQSGNVGRTGDAEKDSRLKAA